MSAEVVARSVLHRIEVVSFSTLTRGNLRSVSCGIGIARRNELFNTDCDERCEFLEVSSVMGLAEDIATSDFLSPDLYC